MNKMIRIIPFFICILSILFFAYGTGAAVELTINSACSGDFDTDGDVDGSDLAVFAADFGRTDCDTGDPCQGDFDADNDVDGSDLAVFAADFGRTDCDIPFPPAPLNQFSIGDSIAEGEAADGTIGQEQHETVWSTGFDSDDIVDSLNERFDDADPPGYYENNADRDAIFNHGKSGAVMADFPTQANDVVIAASATPSGTAGMVTILLGNNDVCTESVDEPMTDPELFEQQYRAGLDVLAASDATKNAYIHVTSLTAIYWLWVAKRNTPFCPLKWFFVPCRNLLWNPNNDCESEESMMDPDTVYPGDGANCVRRKQFHEDIREIYNPILKDVLQEYINDGRLANAYFVDIFDIQFEDIHVNDGDCFHPSVEGHALLAREQWSRSPWNIDSIHSIYFDRTIKNHGVD